VSAHPEVRIELGDDAFDAVATELERAERDDKYAVQVRRYPGFGEYQERTDRTIPVVAIAPVR
jgi:deazaflavin-dependent oxidoreductase (nitroreductase family)